MRTVLLLSIGLMNTMLCTAQERIGTAETFHVKESNVYWKAHVTDSLEFCVINAGNIAIMNTSFPKEKNITKQVSFRLRNADDEGRTVNGRIAGVATYGDQQLYTAELEVGLNLGDRWEYRKVQCILADLSEAPFKLMVGRNWLGSDFRPE